MRPAACGNFLHHPILIDISKPQDFSVFSVASVVQVTFVRLTQCVVSSLTQMILA